jgi:hypothetical protein
MTVIIMLKPVNRVSTDTGNIGVLFSYWKYKNYTGIPNK